MDSYFFSFIAKALAIFLLGICSTTCNSQDVGQLEHKTEPYTFKSNSGKSVEAELGSYSVRENRRRNDSPKITLKYIRFPATGENPGNPIVYLAGGPGGSGSGAAKGRRFEMFMELRQLGDVILFDQRGTGMSNSLPAGASWNIPSDQAATRELLEQAVLTALNESLEIWKKAGVDLNAYNTEESADDLAALCTVLHAKQLRLVGISYGTHLAISYIRRHPKLVERVVLAGVEGPDHTLKLPNDQQQLLASIQTWVDADPETKAKYPDFVEKIGSVLSKLEKEPVTIESSSGKKVITAFDVQRTLAGRLRGPQSFSTAPRLVYAMADGNFAQVAAFHSRLRAGSFRAMSLAMDAASGATPSRMELIKQQASKTVLSDAINFPMNVIVPKLAGLDLGNDFRSPLVSDIPLLAISGTADGRTPPGNATDVLKTLSNGQHLIIHGAGHSDPLFLSSPKILETMKLFLIGDEIDVTEIELRPIKFWK